MLKAFADKNMAESDCGSALSAITNLMRYDTPADKTDEAFNTFVCPLKLIGADAALVPPLKEPKNWGFTDGQAEL